MMQDPRVQDGRVLRSEILNTRIVCATKYVVGRLGEHVEYVRTAKRPCILGAKKTVEFHRILCPAFGYCADVFIEAGDHGHVTGSRFSGHLRVRDRIEAIKMLFLAF